jgi:hypothetical protein
MRILEGVRAMFALRLCWVCQAGYLGVGNAGGLVSGRAALITEVSIPFRAPDLGEQSTGAPHPAAGSCPCSVGIRDLSNSLSDDGT